MLREPGPITAKLSHILGNQAPAQAKSTGFLRMIVPR